MDTTGQLIDYWKSKLVDDLSGFSDPGDPVDCSVAGGKFRVAWIQRGKKREAKFRLTTQSEFRWETENKTILQNYSEFLTSEHMADFNQLAAAILKRHPTISSYVKTTGTRETNGQPTFQEADAALLEEVNLALEQITGTTKVIFLKGDAGAGKTTLLEQLCRSQAERYSKHDASFLFFFVSAKGRALSNLSDALSSELDDLRAGFTRHAIAPLVRQGLIVPIVDGFDELLGAAGYGDAFGSLSQFLAQIQGHGTLLVSARSSFYEVEFLGRASADEAPFELLPVTLNPWGEAQISQYLAQRRGLAEVDTRDKKVLDRLADTDRKLLEKPFFASKFCEYVDANRDLGGSGSLLKFLVDHYIQRESEKIVDRDGQPLLSSEGHKLLFTESAEFMWGQGSREFGLEELRVFAELVGQELGLSQDAAKQLETKITSYAGFKAQGTAAKHRFVFEHEVYFDYFISVALAKKIAVPSALGLLFDKGLISEDVAAQSIADDATAVSALDSISAFSRAGVFQENRRQNTGTLIAACARRLRSITQRNFAQVDFVKNRFGSCVFKEVTFDSCSFKEVRLEGTKFQQCRLLRSTFENVAISKDTRLEIEGLIPGVSVYGIYDSDKRLEYYAPSEIERILTRIGAKLEGTTVKSPRISVRAAHVTSLLQQVIRRLRIANIICVDTDDPATKVVRDKEWTTLERLLLKHGLFRLENRDTSGRSKRFIRPLVNMTEVMKLERALELPDSFTGRFWSEIRGL